MSVLDIRILGDPILREACEPVETFDEELRTLVRDMRETMYEADGIGLAAPQVGVPLRVFVYDVRVGEVAQGVLVNPVIEARSGTMKSEEGCLSIPGISEVLERAERVVVTGLDVDGEPVRIEAEGRLGVCLQHETDHLDGVLFLDRLSPLKRKMALNRWSKSQAEDAVSSGAL
ncbi:MAG TPA: peptide deformylase [Gemmatimonadota bacterium]|nr:peptide deformylase [Gemmatimonadota bacterium]